MKELIGEPVFVLATARTGNILEYYGVLDAEDKDSVTLKDVTINFGAPNYQTKIISASIVKYKQNLEKVVINKDYVVSVNKFKTN